jgi:hypothetical protein
MYVLASSKLPTGSLTLCLLLGRQTWARCRQAPSTATPIRVTTTAAEIAIAIVAAAGAAAETVAAPRAGTTTASATVVVTVAAATMIEATVAATGSTMIEGHVAEIPAAKLTHLPTRVYGGCMVGRRWTSRLHRRGRGDGADPEGAADNVSSATQVVFNAPRQI